jgi:cytochrome c553
MDSERRAAHESAARALRRTQPALATLLALASIAGLAVAATPEPPPASVCTACHGEAGHSVAPTFPNLAGQQAEYLQKHSQTSRRAGG